MEIEILKDMPPWEWPEDARETFLEVINDPRADEARRLLAIELAGDFTVIDSDIADRLVDIVRDGEEPETLRARAAIALGDLLDYVYTDGLEDGDDGPISEDLFRQIRETLREVYQDAEPPEEVRRRALEASVSVPEDWHRDAVALAYSRDDASWKLTAVFCMGHVGGFDDEILESLEAASPALREEAIRAAGRSQIDAAWPHVTGILESPQIDKSLLLSAIEAAASIRPAEVGPAVVELTDSDDEDIVEAAHEAMMMAELFAELEGQEEDLDDDEPMP